MHGVLDGVSYKVGDVRRAHIRLNSQKYFLEGILDPRHRTVPVSITPLDHILGVLPHLYQSLGLLWGW